MCKEQFSCGNLLPFLESKILKDVDLFEESLCFVQHIIEVAQQMFIEQRKKFCGLSYT